MKHLHPKKCLRVAKEKLHDWFWYYLLPDSLTIAKSVVNPNHAIIKHEKFVNKSFEDNGEHCFYSGSPEVLKGKGISWILDENMSLINNLNTIEIIYSRL